ncbi:MAG: hypothetical protein M3444_12705 [Acidobacteriota bacterium]|nr:hypothetical protein [Acidobacteriota bacterium]
MIVLDEQLGSSRIVAGIERWYGGSVITLNELRPGTRVFDDAAPTLLRSATWPTFVTINYKDFWRKIPASPDYCAICLKLPTERSLEVPGLLRWVLALPGLRTKRERMGAVVSVVDRKVVLYRD